MMRKTRFQTYPYRLIQQKGGYSELLIRVLGMLLTKDEHPDLKQSAFLIHSEDLLREVAFFFLEDSAKAEKEYQKLPSAGNFLDILRRQPLIVKADHESQALIHGYAADLLLGKHGGDVSLCKAYGLRRTDFAEIFIVDIKTGLSGEVIYKILQTEALCIDLFDATVFKEIQNRLNERSWALFKTNFMAFFPQLTFNEFAMLWKSNQHRNAFRSRLLEDWPHSYEDNRGQILKYLDGFFKVAAKQASFKATYQRIANTKTEHWS